MSDRRGPRRIGTRGKLRAVSLLALACLHCAGYVRGIEVSLRYTPAPATLGFLLEDGREASLSEAEATIEGVELMPCDATSSAGLLSPLFASTASAHVDEAIEGAGLFNALHGPMNAGMLRPFPGTYCALKVHIGEVRIGGHIERSPIAEAHSEAFDITHTFETPLRLDAEHRDAHLEVGFDQRRWLEEGPIAERLAASVEVVPQAL